MLGVERRTVLPASPGHRVKARSLRPIPEKSRWLRGLVPADPLQSLPKAPLAGGTRPTLAL